METITVKSLVDILPSLQRDEVDMLWHAGPVINNDNILWYAGVDIIIFGEYDLYELTL